MCRGTNSLLLLPAEHVDLEEGSEKKKKFVAKEALHSKWLSKFLWLQPTGKKHELGHLRGSCTVCKEHCSGKSSFASEGGAVIQDANTLCDPEKCIHHIAAVAKASRVSALPLGGGLQGLAKLAHQARDGVIPLLIMAALWLVKEGLAGQKFASLLGLLCTSSIQI